MTSSVCREVLFRITQPARITSPDRSTAERPLSSNGVSAQQVSLDLERERAKAWITKKHSCSPKTASHVRFDVVDTIEESSHAEDVRHERGGFVSRQTKSRQTRIAVHWSRQAWRRAESRAAFNDDAAFIQRVAADGAIAWIGVAAFSPREFRA